MPWGLEQAMKNGPPWKKSRLSRGGCREGGARLAVEHLVAAGRRRIAMVETLLRLLDDPGTKPRQQILPVSLTVRASSSPVASP